MSSRRRTLRTSTSAVPKSTMVTTGSTRPENASKLSSHGRWRLQEAIHREDDGSTDRRATDHGDAFTFPPVHQNRAFKRSAARTTTSQRGISPNRPVSVSTSRRIGSEFVICEPIEVNSTTPGRAVGVLKRWSNAQRRRPLVVDAVAGDASCSSPPRHRPRENGSVVATP